MDKYTINPGLRFVLEIIALFSISYWGWSQHSGWLKYGLAAALPLLIALIWGVFAVKNDPSRSGKTVISTPGWIRLILELGIFGVAGWSFYVCGFPIIGIVFIGLVVFHYVLSIERVNWLIKQ